MKGCPQQKTRIADDPWVASALVTPRESVANMGRGMWEIHISLC